MKIRITVEVNREDREKLAQFLRQDKPANRATCEAALRGAMEAEKDSWYLTAAEKEERDSDLEYREYRKTVEKDRPVETEEEESGFENVEEDEYLKGIMERDGND